MKAYLSDKDDWPTSYYTELLLDTLLEDFTSAEIKDLDVWYGKHEMQEEVYSVSYKITTDDKFLQNMMRSVDALPAKTEANLESVNGRSAEFFKTSVLYARRKLIPRLSFETSVIYWGTYGRKIPLSAMDDSCMILWWVKNKRPYQLFVTSSRDFMDVQRRMAASKISMVTFWSGRTSDVAQGGMTMRDSATAGLGDQPPALPRTLEQIPLQELYRPVPEEVLPPVTLPPIPAEQPIEVDDEDMQPPDQPQQSMQPPLTPPHGGLHVPLPDSPMQDSVPGSPGPPQDPPPPSPPPAGVPVQAPGSPLIHWHVAPGTPPWMPQVAVSQGQPPPPSPPPRAPMLAQQWMPPLWWPPVYPGPLPVAGGTFPSGGTTSSGGMMPLTVAPSPVQPLQPMPPEPSRASPVVQTLDKDDDEDIAEDQPMPAQPLLPARELLPLLIRQLLLRRLLRLRLMQLLGFRLLLRHLFRLCLLRLLLMHLLKVLSLQLPRRPDSMTFRRSSPCSQCHTCSLRCPLPPALPRHCQNPTQRLPRRNLRRRNISRRMRRTTMISLWIHSIHCSRQILHCYLYPNTSPLLQ